MSFPKVRNKFGQAAQEAVGSLNGTYMSYLRHKAKTRGLVWELSKEYLWELFEKQNGLCAISKTPLEMSTKINKHNNVDRTNHTASLDRIDNNVGYIEGNVQWVHKQINLIRRELTVEDFVMWCHLVHHANPEPSRSGDTTEGATTRDRDSRVSNIPTSLQPPIVGEDIV
jgi:hypothetical protein